MAFRRLNSFYSYSKCTRKFDRCSGVSENGGPHFGSQKVKTKHPNGCKVGCKGFIVKRETNEILGRWNGVPARRPTKKGHPSCFVESQWQCWWDQKKGILWNFYLQFLPFIYYAGQMMINHDKPLDGLGSPIFNSYRRGYLTREPLGIDLTIEHRNWDMSWTLQASRLLSCLWIVVGCC